jgi:hypothetical protein
MTQKVEGGSVRGVLTNLWLTAESAAAHVRCPEGKLAPRPLLDQGRNVAEYLAVLPSRDA